MNLTTSPQICLLAALKCREGVKFNIQILQGTVAADFKVRWKFFQHFLQQSTAHLNASLAVESVHIFQTYTKSQWINVASFLWATCACADKDSVDLVLLCIRCARNVKF